MATNKKEEWNESYKRKENFLFYPNEEIVRFFSKHIARKNNYKEVAYVQPFNEKPRLLDLGCGIGRHLIFAHNMGCDVYGADLSEVAIKTAREWAAHEGILNVHDRIMCCDTQHMPFAQKQFDFVISHGVLDSMHIAILKKVVVEVHRVMKDGALFYCDLISGDDSKHSVNFSGEEVVNTIHESGTVQLYFNQTQINEVFSNYFHLKENYLIKTQNIQTGDFYSRYYLTLQKK